MYDRFDLKWADNELRLISDKLLCTIERDEGRPSLFRVCLPSGYRSDAVDQDRARDVAVTLALESLTTISRPDRTAS